MTRLKKRTYDFDESINDFMIYCTNKDLTKETMKSYEGTLKLFAKYLADEVNIFTPKDVTNEFFEKIERNFTNGRISENRLDFINNLLERVQENCNE